MQEEKKDYRDQQHSVEIPEKLWEKDIHKLRDSLITNSGLEQYSALLAPVIDEQISALQPGWEGMEIIKYDDFEAYCNCYEYNGIYEIRFLIAQVKKY